MRIAVNIIAKSLAQSWIGLDGIWIHINLSLITCLRRWQDINGVPSDIYFYFYDPLPLRFTICLVSLMKFRFLYILLFDMRVSLILRIHETHSI